jgi:tRNA(adenine34) deaminase
MCRCTRRSAMVMIAAASLAVATRAKAAVKPAAASEHQEFIAAAFRMKDEAVALGDQPYGAVVVSDGRIVGFGPSRVILRKDASAHAEREAIRDAQARRGAADLSECVLYSTSRPCAACERAAAQASIARMIHGADAIDAGRPR